MITILSLSVLLTQAPAAAPQSPPPTPAAATREFEIRKDRAFLGGKPVDLWGLRCGNALHSWTVTERHVRALDTMAAHGINLIGLYVQGSHGGWPNPDAGANGYRRDGSLKKDFGERLAWLCREADARGMVVMVGLFTPRKDQLLDGPKAVQHAIEDTATFLVQHRLKNVFVDIIHEYDHSERADLDLFREPGGEGKKAQLTQWFKNIAPDIEVGVCPYEKSTTTDSYPGMDVRIIQKSMPIPANGFVVNVETQKQDAYENDGVFTEGHIDAILADCARYQAAPNAAMMFHAAYLQGISGFSGTGPHPEMGGYGTSPSDRGVRFYYDWVRDHVGRWEYPNHVPVPAATADAKTATPAPTREFEIRGELPYLGGEPIKLWGLRCNNGLLSPAVTERLINNLPNMAAHGINFISVAMQGTNGGFPDVDAGTNSYAPDGHLIPGPARRLEAVVRAADQLGMVVLVGLMMPRKDQLLRDENAVRRGVEETAVFLESHGLRNVMVNLFQEFHHPTRIDHDIFREPFGAQKKATLTAWFKSQAPHIEVGICPNHLNGSLVDYPGCEVQMYHELMPIPEHGFAVNTETPDSDLPGNEGVFNRFHRERMVAIWNTYLPSPRTAMLFRAPYLEDVRGVQGTGPNPEMGGNGTSETDRGVRFYFEWVQKNVGRWAYPKHVAAGH